MLKAGSCVAMPGILPVALPEFIASSMLGFRVPSATGTSTILMRY